MSRSDNNDSTIFFSILWAIVVVCCITIVLYSMLFVQKTCSEKCAAESMLATGKVGDKCVCEVFAGSKSANKDSAYIIQRDFK